MATLVKIQGNAVFNGGIKFQVTGVDTPLTPSLSSITPNGFTLSWDQVQDAFEYQLDISANSNFSSFVAGYNNTTVPTTSAVVTGLSPQTTYWARIRAVVASTNSASVSGTTLEQTSTLTNNLLAFYKLSDTSDSSGNSNTLTNNNGVTFSAGKIGNAAVFDGTNDFSISSPIPATYPLTVSAWINPTYIESGWVFESNYFLLGVGDASFFGVGEGPAIFAAANYNPSYAAGSIQLNGWSFVTAVWDNPGETRLYVNGQLVDTKALGSNEGGTVNALGIGNGRFPLVGKLDGVGIWNRALTQSEVTELYNAGNGLEIN